MTDVDVAVIGGGPGGLAAAIVASNAGLRVAILEERATLGGQIYKRMGKGFHVDAQDARMGSDYNKGAKLIAAAESSGANIMTDCTVISVDSHTIMYSLAGEHVKEMSAAKVIVSAGAADRAVSFPGWTLPGVITAGGAQSLAKSQRISFGSRVVFAGSGPLALAFPAQLAHLGINVISLLEAGPAPRAGDLWKVAKAYRGNLHLLRDAAKYRAQIFKHRIDVNYRRIVVRAEGHERVERVIHAAVDSDWNPIPGTEKSIEADALCLGYGFVPSIETLRLFGCEFTVNEDLGGPCVVIDEECRTTAPDVWAVGDGAGVEGVYVAMSQGKIAALSAIHELRPNGTEGITVREINEGIARERKKITQKRALVGATKRMYKFGEGAYRLATPDTIICRCESVTLDNIDLAMQFGADTNSIKAMTRAGMGLCQGRNCQRQIVHRIHENAGIPVDQIPLSTPRFPLRPVTLGSVADASVESDKFFTPVEEAQS